MDQVWLVAALWSLVGLAATLIAIWIGGGVRDEIRRMKTVRLDDAVRPTKVPLA